MFTEDDLLPISSLQHLAFCPRQWALIHLEGIWSDNRLTAEGTLMHEHAHDAETESRRDLRIARGLRLRSLRFGLVGQADVVEFHKTENKNEGVKLAGIEGFWQPIIIEYKHGKPKIDYEDEVQLCAQALCLEEMLECSIPGSSFFYGQPKRRQDVNLSNDLRKETESLIALLHELTTSGRTPKAEYSTHCQNCSLVHVCLPKIATSNKGRKSVKEYILESIQNPEGTHEAST